MKDNVKIFLSVIVLILVLGLWLFMFHSDDVTEGTTDNSGTVQVNNAPPKESIDNPPSERIKQYRMNYNYSDNQDLIIDLLEGDVTFAMEYPGSDNFRVMLKTNKGEDVKLLIDKKGPVAELVRFNAPYLGPYLLEVRTKGTWRVEHR